MLIVPFLLLGWEASYARDLVILFHSFSDYMYFRIAFVVPSGRGPLYAAKALDAMHRTLQLQSHYSLGDQSPLCNVKLHTSSLPYPFRRIALEQAM